MYNTSLLDLVFRAASVHRLYNDPSMVRRCSGSQGPATGPAVSEPLWPAAAAARAAALAARPPPHRPRPRPRSQVQRCTLLSIKTGGCPETCNYCSQSSSWSKETGTKAEKLMGLEDVYAAALRAKAAGSTRFCMGAAWRGPSQVGKGQWQRVLDMVTQIRGLGMEVCTTLGMLTPEQAAELRVAGLTAYNHNLDTSPEFYGQITTSRKYEDRLATIENVRQAGISVCAGGIIGLGEGRLDRIGLLHQVCRGREGQRRGWRGLEGAEVLAGARRRSAAPLRALRTAAEGQPALQTWLSDPLPPAPAPWPLTLQLATLVEHPESVPINALVAVKGTPQEGQEPPSGLDIVRCVATARVVMPRTVVRLSAGRMNFSAADQAMCFLAGANSIFDGDKLLTTPNNDRNEDLALFEALGLKSRPAFVPYAAGNESSSSFEGGPGGGGGGGCGGGGAAKKHAHA